MALEGTSFNPARTAAALRTRHSAAALPAVIAAEVLRGDLTPAQATEVAGILGVVLNENKIAAAYVARARTGFEAYGVRPQTAGGGPRDNVLNFRTSAAATATSSVTASPVSAIVDVRQIRDTLDLVRSLPGRVLFVTDLDYTVLVTKDGVGRDVWYEELIKRKCCEGMTVSQAEAFADDVWVKAQMFNPVVPVESDTPGVIGQLRETAAMAMALTSRDLRLVDTTPRQLDALGAALNGGALHPDHSGALTAVSDYRDGILTIKPGENKGTHLVSFLARFGLAFDHVVMVDDKHKNLTDMQAAFAAEGVSFTGCHYETGKALDVGLDLEATRALEAAFLQAHAPIEDTRRRSLLDRPSDVRREALPPRVELDALPHTLNMGPNDFPMGQKVPIEGAAWYNKWNEPLYGPALNGSISQIVFLPRRGTKEMMRVAHVVPHPNDAGKSFGVLTNAQGHHTFVAFDGRDHAHANGLTPVPRGAVPPALQAWTAAHLQSAPRTQGFRTKEVPTAGPALDAFLESMAASQIALSGTAKRSPDLEQKVKANLVEMNRHMLGLIASGKDLALEDLEFLNALATRGKSHYGDDIENVRGVARGFSRMILNEGGELARIQNHEHIESTVALNFSPPHVAAAEIKSLLAEINAVRKGTSLEEIARLYQKVILIHPFSDGTGRTSFCILDAMLIKSGREPLPHTEESGIPLFKSVRELASEFSRAYEQR